MKHSIIGPDSEKYDEILYDLSGKARGIDIFVGNQLRKRRKELHISQTAIAKRIGITYQQIQKYESGTNRVSAGILYLIGAILRVDISYFFQGVGYITTDPALKINEMQAAASDINDEKLKDAIMGIIDVAKKMPDKL